MRTSLCRHGAGVCYFSSRTLATTPLCDYKKPQGKMGSTVQRTSREKERWAEKQRVRPSLPQEVCGSVITVATVGHFWHAVARAREW